MCIKRGSRQAAFSTGQEGAGQAAPAGRHKRGVPSAPRQGWEEGPCSRTVKRAALPPAEQTLEGPPCKLP